MAAAYVFLFIVFLQVFQGSIANPVEGNEVGASIVEENGLSSWFDDCSNLTVTYNDLYNFTVRLAPWLVEFSMTLGSDLSAVLSCSGLVSTIPCVIENFEKTKEDLLKYQPALEKYLEEGYKLMDELKVELESCFFQKTNLYSL